MKQRITAFVLLPVLAILLFGGAYWRLRYAANNNAHDYLKFVEEVGKKKASLLDPGSKYFPVIMIENEAAEAEVLYPDIPSNEGGKIRMTFRYDTIDERGVDPSKVNFYIIKADQSVIDIPVSSVKDDPTSSKKTFYDGGPWEDVYSHSIEMITDMLYPGRYIARISIENGRISHDKEVYVNERGFLQDISLDPNTVHFDSSSFAQSYDVTTVKTHVREEGNIWTDIDSPGYLLYSFHPLRPSIYGEDDTVEMGIYPVSLVSKSGPDNFANQFNLPPFVSVVRALRSIVSGDLDLSGTSGLANFPPANATPVGVDRAQRLNFMTGKGVRFTVIGFYQDYYYANHPKYMYRGITDDGKYIVSFRYESLFSPKLERYLKAAKKDVSNMDAFNAEIAKSYDVLSSEIDFRPSLKILDQFVRSIRIDSSD